MKKKGKLIYFADPMCSWCWGITKHLEKLKAYNKDKLSFEMIMGGLRPVRGGEWLPDIIKEHWDHVREYSDQPFNYDLLKKKYFDYHTEPACRAVRVIRDIAPDKEYDFFKEVQHEFYVVNNDPKELEFYKPICKKMNIAYDTFKPLFVSNRYEELIKKDFIKTNKASITGFPSVILQRDKKLKSITTGFSTFETMQAQVSKLS